MQGAKRRSVDSRCRINRQIVEVIFKMEISGREANDCADSSRKAVTVEKDGLDLKLNEHHLKSGVLTSIRKLDHVPSCDD
jgi:hypothetical protein